MVDFGLSPNLTNQNRPATHPKKQMINHIFCLSQVTVFSDPNASHGSALDQMSSCFASLEPDSILDQMSCCTVRSDNSNMVRRFESAGSSDSCYMSLSANESVMGHIKSHWAREAQTKSTNPCRSADHFETVFEKRIGANSIDQEAPLHAATGPRNSDDPRTRRNAVGESSGSSRVGNEQPLHARGDQRAAPQEAEAPSPSIVRPFANMNLIDSTDHEPPIQMILGAASEQDDVSPPVVPPDMVRELHLQCPLIAVETPCDCDTLMGRGDGPNHHQGNKRMHEVKTALQPLYLQASKSPNLSASKSCKTAISRLLFRSRQGQLKDFFQVTSELRKIKEQMKNIAPEDPKHNSEFIQEINEYIVALESCYLLFVNQPNMQFLQPVFFDEFGNAYKTEKEKKNTEKWYFKITEERAVGKTSQALREIKAIKKEWRWTKRLEHTQLWKNLLLTIEKQVQKTNSNKSISE